MKNGSNDCLKISGKIIGQSILDFEFINDTHFIMPIFSGELIMIDESKSIIWSIMQPTLMRN